MVSALDSRVSRNHGQGHISNKEWSLENNGLSKFSVSLKILESGAWNLVHCNL